MFQRVGLFPHMTVAENIGITPQLLGWDDEAIRARVDKLLALVADQLLCAIETGLKLRRRGRVAAGVGAAALRVGGACDGLINERRIELAAFALAAEAPPGGVTKELRSAAVVAMPLVRRRPLSGTAVARQVRENPAGVTVHDERGRER